MIVEVEKYSIHINIHGMLFGMQPVQNVLGLASVH